MNPSAAAWRPSPTRRVDRDVVGTLLASLPPLTNVQRQAFRAQHSAAQGDEASARVEAAAAHAQALDWLPLIDRALTETPLLVRRYGRARFAWLLECVRDLGDSLEMAGNGAPSERADRVHRVALRVREDLLEALDVLVTGDEEERAALAGATGNAESPEALATSLRALARLADDWMDREAPLARALVASVDLSAADAEAARAAAHAVVGGGQHDGHGDPPAAARSEGRVILELGLVQRIFERAHRNDARVPLLPPAP